MSKAPVEPTNTISIYKWNLVGRNKLLKQEMFINGTHKVKVVITETNVRVLKVNHKHPNVPAVAQAFETVKSALKEYYPELPVTVIQDNTTKK